MKKLQLKIWKRDKKSSFPSSSGEMINWFEVDKKGNFVRTFAPLINIDDHTLTVLLQGKEMQINSKYSVRDYLEDDASFLYMFSYKPSIVDKIRSFGFNNGELFPLPPGRSYFDASRDLTHNYSKLSQEELDLYIRSDSDVKKLETALENAKKQVGYKLESIKNESVDLSSPTIFSSTLSTPKPVKKEIPLKTKKLSSQKVKSLSRKSQKQVKEMFTKVKY